MYSGTVSISLASKMAVVYFVSYEETAYVASELQIATYDKHINNPVWALLISDIPDASVSYRVVWNTIEGPAAHVGIKEPRDFNIFSTSEETGSDGKMSSEGSANIKFSSSGKNEILILSCGSYLHGTVQIYRKDRLLFSKEINL